MSGPPHRQFREFFLSGLTPFVAALLASSFLALWGYGGTCQYPFVFDDFPGIINNDAVKNFYASGGGGFGSLFSFAGERVLTFLTFAWSWAGAGPDPCAFRMVNLALHVMNSTLAGLICLALFQLSGGKPSNFQRYALVLFAACLFSAHPLQTQAVTYIYQRLAGLCAFFCLLSFFLCLRWLLTGLDWLRFLSILALCFAAISKQNSAMLPVVILAAVWFFRRQAIRGIVLFFFPAAVIPILMVLSNGTLSGRIASYGTSDLSWWQYFLTQGRVIWRYVWLMVWPPAQSVDHVVYLVKDIWSVGAILGLTGWGLIAGISWLAFLKTADATATPVRRVIGFGVIWFFAMLMIESSVIPIRDLVMEQRVYLPFAGVAWALSVSMISLSETSWIQGHRRIFYAAVSVVMVAMASMTEVRNRVWRSSETLWRSVLVTDPESPRAQLNLGNALLREGRFEDALILYDVLAKGGGLQADALYHRALVLILLRRFEEADQATRWFANDFPNEGLRVAYLRAQSDLLGGNYRDAAQKFSALQDHLGSGGSFQRHVRMGIARAGSRLASSSDLGPAERAKWLLQTVSSLRKILDEDALDVEARARLARIFARSGETSDALKALAATPVNMGATDAAWLALVKAEILEDPARPNAALQEYRMAIARYSGHEALLIWFGSFLATLSDNDQIHQTIGGKHEIDLLADFALVQAARLQGSFQLDESVSFLRRALLLCEAGAHKCSRQGDLLKALGAVLILADPDAQSEAEGLISRGRALAPEESGIAPTL